MNRKIKIAIRQYINFLFENYIVKELDTSVVHSPKYSHISKKIMGDNSIVVLNKIRLGEELTIDEMEEARENYLNEYITAKIALDDVYKKANPINLMDLETIFEKGGYILNNYLKNIINKYSNVEQISGVERASLLNLKMYNIPYNANDNIAKKYIIKTMSNIEVPQAKENKWTQYDSAEISKAYNMSLSDQDFRKIIIDILSTRGKQSSNLYKKLKEIDREQNTNIEGF
ncbi:MAG: hypothetical protein WC466_09120 [Candidatus Izemoplasmatales bacterium]